LAEKVRSKVLKKLNESAKTVGATSGPVSLLDVPAYAAAATRLATLNAQLQEINESIRLRETELRKPTDVAAQAQAVIDGALAKDVVRISDDEEIARLLQHRKIQEAAIQMMGTEVETLKGEAGFQVCETFRPRHAAAVRALGHALIELGRAIEKEMEIREILTREGVSFTYLLRPMPFAGCPVRPTVRNSSIALWFAGAVRAGLFPKEEIPKEWREIWAGPCQ
jgi:hypothetical protein